MKSFGFQLARSSCPTSQPLSSIVSQSIGLAIVMLYPDEHLFTTLQEPGLSQHEYRGKDGQIVSDQNVTRERCQGGYGLQESLAFLLSTCSEILATLESSLLPAPTPEASIRLMSHKSMVSIMSESHYRRSLASTTPVIGTLSIVRRDTHLEKAPTPSNHDLSPQYVFFWTEARR